MWNEIVVGAYGNALFLLVSVLIALFIYGVSRRWRLLSFFRIGDERKISIYIARLNVLPMGAADHQGVPRSYQGPAVVHGELTEAMELGQKFKSLFPGLSGQTSFLSSLSLADVAVFVKPAPTNSANVDKNESFVSIGSPAYNVASELIEKTFSSPVSFAANGQSFSIPGLPPISNPYQGYILRIPNGENSIFYIAGLSELGTCGAVHYLTRNWAKLHKRFRESPSFLVLVEMNQADHRFAKVVAERVI